MECTLLKKPKLWLVAVGVISLLFLIGLELALYVLGHKRIEQSIEDRLYVAAEAANLFYGEQYHKELSPNSISLAQDIERSRQLSAVATDLNVSYVYSLILDNNTLRFISSSMTEEELSGGEYEPVYWTVYDDAPKVIAQVFTTGESASANYTDQWGQFLSVFVPKTTADGTPYVIGIDLQVDNLRVESALGTALTLVPLLLMLGVILPLYLMLIKTEAKRNKAELNAAYTDRTTGLGNRNQLVADLETYHRPALALINIDQFREVANTFGIAFGDQVLAEYAYFLQCYRNSQFSIAAVYRLQGAEFAVLIEKGEAFVNSEAAVEDLRRHCNWFQYHLENGESLALSATLGIASNDVDALLLADTALRHAKVHRRDCVVYQHELAAFDMYERNLRDVHLFRKALVERRLVPYFQPLVDMDDGHVVRYEVLARIEGEEGEVAMLPADFVPIAERYRLNRQLSVTIIQQTLKKLVGNKHLVSFNLSLRDIENPNTAKRILDIVKRSGLAKRLSFELLENEAMRNRERVVQFFVDLRKMGAKVGVDDLGKEYSNFDRLIELPLDFVKIDGGVIHHALKNTSTLEVLKTFVREAKSCGLETIAECIDSPETSALAASLGVDICQGFYYGLPNSDFSVVTDQPQTMAASVGGVG